MNDEVYQCRMCPAFLLLYDDSPCDRLCYMCAVKMRQGLMTEQGLRERFPVGDPQRDEQQMYPSKEPK